MRDGERPENRSGASHIVSAAGETRSNLAVS
jgi:hypothetical protein